MKVPDMMYIIIACFSIVIMLSVAILADLYRSRCRHKWIKENEETIGSESGDIRGRIYLYRCETCGRFKKITIRV